MGHETNIRSVRGLRRLTKSKTQVIFFDNSCVMKMDEKALTQLPQCKEEVESKRPTFRTGPGKHGAVSGGERMFSFKELLEIFNDLERGTGKRASKPTASINPADALGKDVMLQRRHMFDHAYGNFLEQKKHAPTLSKE
ncbi:hypothetical protein [Encephalitozoon cuniculi GB-M1]|uniref:Uncharacterized protein n=1 Tax=Encephalitozoon cuniculi (strain GB-M1) TaxID=284813 RepID=Q8SUG9_ENCCU|nr:uncharacterized protein ECU10_0370 [Encephalitozoon cuniculi GB-M1]CAD25756.3 hypothetical protein [Encephalitozoon cuniculi GB-M1]